MAQDSSLRGRGTAAKRWSGRHVAARGGPRSSVSAVRTVVVSDLHLGTRSEADVLRRRVAREKLIERVDGADRLVLLGDTIELRQGPAREAMAVAQPVLEELGAVLGKGGEVILVPGNHDHALVAPWLERRGAHVEPPPLNLEEHPGPDASAATEAIAQWLAPARLTVAYPGIWLRDDVYATHGHYLDVHLTMPRLEAVAAGVMARVSKRSRNCRSVDDYEAVMSPLYAALARLAEGSPADRLQRGGSMSRSLWAKLNPPDGGGGVSRFMLARVAFPSAVAALNLAGLGPLKTEITGEELRRAGLRAMGRVAEGMGVRAEHVLFGHTHRSGPWGPDDPAEWRSGSGARLWNTGSWLYERAFLRGERLQSNPYWPGVVIRVDDSGEPRLENVLGDVSPAACLP